MKWLGYVRKSVKSLRLPGEIGRRQKHHHVMDLAADIRELGEEPINAPVFDKAGNIIAGRDRMAALLINKTKRCWIRIADATEQERSDLEVSENLYRRVDNRDEMIARRVHRVMEKVAAEKRASSPKGVPSPARQTVVSEARKRVARELNSTPKAVARAEEREKARAVANVPKVEPPGDSTSPPNLILPPGAIQARGFPIDTFDVEVSPAFHERVSAVWDVLGAVNRHLVNAQTELAKLKGSADFPGAQWQRLKSEIHAAAYNTRAAKPALVCLYCRDPDDTALLRDNCNGCNKLGYLTEEQRAMVPRELMAKGSAPVVGASAKRKATISVLDGNGNPIDVTKDDPPSLPLPLGPS